MRERVRFVGIDGSLTSTGIHVGSHRVEDTGGASHAICPPDGVFGQRRLDFIVETTLAMLEPVEVGIVVFERAAFSRGDRAHAKGELHGVLRRELWLRGLWIADIAPNTLKVFGCAHGGLKKPQVVKEVYKRWGFEADSDDEVDAFVCSRVGAALAAPTISGPGHWLRALEKVGFEPPKVVL